MHMYIGISVVEEGKHNATMNMDRFCSCCFVILFTSDVY